MPKTKTQKKKLIQDQLWISVKKKLPAHNQLVIMAGWSDSEDEGWVVAGQLQILNKYSKKWYNQWESFEAGDCECWPTHWLPLPLPPNKYDQIHKVKYK